MPKAHTLDHQLLHKAMQDHRIPPLPMPSQICPYSAQLLLQDHAHNNCCLSLHVIVFSHILLYSGKGAHVSYSKLALPSHSLQQSFQGAVHITPSLMKEPVRKIVGSARKVQLIMKILWHIFGWLKDFTSHKKKQRPGTEHEKKIRAITSQRGTGSDMLRNMLMVF